MTEIEEEKPPDDAKKIEDVQPNALEADLENPDPATEEELDALGKDDDTDEDPKDFQTHPVDDVSEYKNVEDIPDKVWNYIHEQKEDMSALKDAIKDKNPSADVSNDVSEYENVGDIPDEVWNGIHTKKENQEKWEEVASSGNDFHRETLPAGTVLLRFGNEPSSGVSESQSEEREKLPTYSITEDDAKAMGIIDENGKPASPNVIQDKLGLPADNSAKHMERITLKEETQVFKSTVAPTTEGDIKHEGGAIQTHGY